MTQLETFFIPCHIGLMEPEAFKAWRKAQGLTQLQAGNLLGVDRTTVVRWESGESTPVGKLLDLACKQLERDDPVS